MGWGLAPAMKHMLLVCIGEIYLLVFQSNLLMPCGWRKPREEICEAKSHKAKFHEKSGISEIRTAIVRLDRFYQSRKVAQNACLMHYFMVKRFFLGSQSSTWEPFQEATSTVLRKLYTMRIWWKMYHRAKYGGLCFNATGMSRSRAFERHCANYWSTTTRRTLH